MYSGSTRQDSNAEAPQSPAQSKAEEGIETSISHHQFVMEYIYVLYSHLLTEEPKCTERFL